MGVKERVFDRCLANILDCVTDHKLQELGIESLYEVYNRDWLLNWFKHGCPVNKNSYYYNQQLLAKQLFSDVLNDREFNIYLDDDDLEDDSGEE